MKKFILATTILASLVIMSTAVQARQVTWQCEPVLKLPTMDTERLVSFDAGPGYDKGEVGSVTGLDLKPLFYRDMTVYFGPRAVSFVFQLPTGGLDVITILRETGDAIISQNTVYADGVFPHMQAKTKCKEI